ncbi:MAG TPA: hypothetical protein VFX43_08080 [Chitinophagaceae bacterium]|nr:hypothetical protein [Chitinophagaceae bacterium]
MSLMLDLTDTLNLLFKTGIIDGWGKKIDFEDTIVTVSATWYGRERMFRIPLGDVLHDLQPVDCMKVIQYHESLKEFDKKGGKQMATDTLNQLRELEALKERGWK